jgi:hypothetical protein
MTKDSAGWLALRILGLLALGRAFLSMLSVLVNIANLLKLYGVTSETLATRTAVLILEAQVSAGVAFVQVIFFVLVAFYFLRRGRLVHKLLMHESAHSTAA